jgi:hypothetical protein
MTDALSQALANAAYNSPKDSQVHLENIDSIVDPTQDEFIAFDTELNKALQPPQYTSGDAAFSHTSQYELKMRDEYAQKMADSNATTSSIHHLSVLVQGVKDDVHHIINMIQTAASMQSEPNHKHRSLHEWDDQYLINELVERENDLMPFYYELLKRIGSPDLQSLVMSSMQGKNNSMVTLAQLCSALGSNVAPQPISSGTVLIPSNPIREKQKQAEALLKENMLSEEQQKALSDEDYHNWATYMNQLCEASTLMMRFPLTRNHEPIKWNRETEYPATIPSMPPTYNPYFKER